MQPTNSVFGWQIATENTQIRFFRLIQEVRHLNLKYMFKYLLFITIYWNPSRFEINKQNNLGWSDSDSLNSMRFLMRAIYSSWIETFKLYQNNWNSFYMTFLVQRETNVWALHACTGEHVVMTLMTLFAHAQNHTVEKLVRRVSPILIFKHNPH